MITHKIELYKPVYESTSFDQARRMRENWMRSQNDETGEWWNTRHPPQPTKASTIYWDPVNVIVPDTVKGGWVSHRLGPTTPKHIYENWINNIPFKRGDYILSKSLKNRDHVIAAAYLRVQSLMMLHYACQYSHKGRPICMELLSHSGTRFWTTIDEWEVVDAPTDPEAQFDLAV